MPEENTPDEFSMLWRSQAQESFSVTRQQLANRRTRELYFATRSEILTSIAAAVLLIAVMAWRLGSAHSSLVLAGFAAIFVWILITLVQFRGWIWRTGTTRGDSLAAPGLEYYRRELARRRDHLRNEWVWHGPLILACLLLAATFIGRAYPGIARFETVLPLLILLAAWAVFGVRQRRRQAAYIQRQIDELDRLTS